MDSWIYELKQIGLMLFGRSSSSEMWGTAVFAIFIVFLTFHKMCAGFTSRGNKSHFTLIPGVFVTLLAVAAVRIFLDASLLIQFAAAVVTLLVFAIPLTMAVDRVGYFSALIPWLVCALLLAGILVLEPIVMNLVSNGIDNASIPRAPEIKFPE